MTNTSLHTNQPQPHNTNSTNMDNANTDSTATTDNQGVLLKVKKDNVDNDETWFGNLSNFGIELDSNQSITDAILSAWQSLMTNIKHSYIKTTDSLIDELLIKLSQEQVNDALNQFVVQNVDMMHELYMNLYDDWLQLHATVDIKGVFAKVSCDFRLVQAIINGEQQRLVFEQLSDVNIIEFHSKTWWYVPAAKTGIKAFKLVCKQDPLAFGLSKIDVKGLPFVTHKGKFIYLDINRYLTGNAKIINTLQKVQVNHATTGIEKLLLKVQINFGELLNFGSDNDDIISEDDNPNQQDLNQQDDDQ